MSQKILNYKNKEIDTISFLKSMIIKFNIQFSLATLKMPYVHT